MKKALPPIVNGESTILILGTMPGEKSIARQQYYANPGNSFWKIIFKIFDEPFSPDYECRLELLKKHRIALWNVLSHCEREGSSDHKIRNEHPNDFEKFFDRYPNITRVYFESHAAARYYAKYAKMKEGIACVTLPSASGQNARMRFEEKCLRWKALCEVRGLDK